MDLHPELRLRLWGLIVVFYIIASQCVPAVCAYHSENGEPQNNTSLVIIQGPMGFELGLWVLANGFCCRASSQWFGVVGLWA